MTVGALATCSAASAPDRSCSPTGPMTATRSATAWPNAEPGRTSGPMPRRVNVPAFSSFLYRYRNLVERFFNKIKHCRRAATRYDKLAANYLADIREVARNVA